MDTLKFTNKFFSCLETCKFHIISENLLKIFITVIKMKDRLDTILNATYQHDKELFPDTCDVYFQPITVKPPRKRLQRKDYAKSFGKNISMYQGQYGRKYNATSMFHKRLYSDHPLIIGGIKERIHPSYVKLMNSSHHSPQTNAGYVRQDRDGNVFQY